MTDNTTTKSAAQSAAEKRKILRDGIGYEFIPLTDQATLVAVRPAEPGQGVYDGAMSLPIAHAALIERALVASASAEARRAVETDAAESDAPVMTDGPVAPEPGGATEVELDYALRVRVTDQAALYDAACEKLWHEGQLSPEEAEAYLAPEGKVDLGNCLRSLVDPDESSPGLPGLEVLDSSAGPIGTGLPGPTRPEVPTRPAGSAGPADPSLSEVDTEALLAELHRRTDVVISAWVLRDFQTSFEEDEYLPELDEEEVERAAKTLMNRMGHILQDVLGERGNAFLNDCDSRREEIVYEIMTGRTPHGAP